MNKFYAKWLNDIRLNQVPGGDIPFIAPRPIYEGPAFSWSCGFHLITWYHYLYYGDEKILEENFDSMKKYVDYLSSLAEDFILPGDKYGDWASPLAGMERRNANVCFNRILLLHYKNSCQSIIDTWYFR